jgi:hypothetical protein
MERIRRVPPFALDVALAFAILLVSVLDLAVWVQPADIPSDFHAGWLSYVLMSVAAVALGLRRRHLLAAYSLWVLAGVVGTLAHSIFVVRSSWLLPEFVLVFSLAEQWTLPTALGGLGAEFALDIFSLFYSPWVQGFLLHLFVLYAVEGLGFAWFAGRAARRRTRLTRQLRVRSAKVRYEQDRLTEQAIASERWRIAHELRPLVVREIHQMAADARSARRELALDPDRAPLAIERIEASGRTALAEMARVLQLMDTDDIAPDLLSLRTAGVNS